MKSKFHAIAPRVEGAGRLTGATARVLGWAAGTFYDVERLGPPIPGGPVLVVANHPNVFLDAFVVFRATGRPARPLALASHFENPFYGPFLRALGGLPVHRRQEDPSLMHRNEDTFRAAVAALHAGDAVQIYPEGRSHSEPSLAPLRTGAARIALRAESEAGWDLGLRVVPVGLTYTRKSFFRGRAAAAVGEPFGVACFADAYAADPTAAVRTLTDEIADRLEAVTLNLAEAEDFDLVETAERLYAREKGWVGWREREGLGERLPRLQAFARGLAWLRAHDPGRHRRIARSVRRYGQLRDLLEAGEADVPPRYEAAGVARYALREGALLLLGLPFAALGIAAWWLPYLVPRLVVRFARPQSQAVATYKLAGAMAVLPLWYVGLVLLLGWRIGPAAAAVGAAILPLAGLFALVWTGRWERVREDSLLFLRIMGRPRERDRLAGHRARLAAEFDAVLRDSDGKRRDSSAPR